MRKLPWTVEEREFGEKVLMEYRERLISTYGSFEKALMARIYADKIGGGVGVGVGGGEKGREAIEGQMSIMWGPLITITLPFHENKWETLSKVEGRERKIIGKLLDTPLIMETLPSWAAFKDGVMKDWEETVARVSRIRATTAADISAYAQFGIDLTLTIGAVESRYVKLGVAAGKISEMGK